MDVAIGIQFAFRELNVETEQSSETVKGLIDKAFQDGEKVLWLTDKRGKQVAIPLEKLAYIEVGADASDKRVGFSMPPIP